MNKEIKLKHYDKNGQLVREERMQLDEYTAQLKNSIQRVIGDVERLIYVLNGNHPREEWSDETVRQFGLIRRQLLDTAGDVGRIPDAMVDAHDRDEQERAFWGKIFGDNSLK